MKKYVKYSRYINVAFVLFVILVVLLSLFFGNYQTQADTTDTVKRASERSACNFLILGKDNAAGLCDVVILGSANADSGDVNLMQIPRDTYLKYTDSSYKKLNGAYNSLGSAYAVSQILSEALGVEIDYYIAFDLETVSKMVDIVKGIEVNVPCDMDYDDPAQNLSIHLKAGKQILDGKSAVEFLRYRSGYITGDIGRLDAQKLFLNAFAQKMKNTKDPITLYNIYKLISSNAETNIKEQDLISMGLKYNPSQNKTISYMTAPGEAVQSEISGAWYYILSRPAMTKLLDDVFNGRGNFDKNNKFVDNDVKSFYDIYNKFCDIRIYTADEIEKNGININ